MPQVGFGEKLPTGGSQFIKLTSKGDHVRIRLLDAPFIEGKHFFQTGVDDTGKPVWDIQGCPRVNEGGKCEHCDKFFALKRRVKKESDKTVIAQLNKEAEKWKPSTMVHYPVIDRLNACFAIFQTTVGVREQIEAEYSLGVKVLEVDFNVLRTETPGSGYYKVSRVDSAETTPLLPSEVEAAEAYKSMNLADLVGGRYDEDSNTAFEANSEVVSEDFADNV
jgi:hypothetical protein